MNIRVPYKRRTFNKLSDYQVLKERPCTI